jgi:thioredoxin-like negative regulator of GroEL
MIIPKVRICVLRKLAQTICFIFTIACLTILGSPTRKVFAHDNLANNCQQDSAKLMLLSKKYLKQGRLKAAQNLIETALALDPNSAAARLCLAEILVRLQEYAQARQVLRRCLRVTNNADIANEANQQLFKLPKRFLNPMLRGSLIEASPDRSAHCYSLIVFCANWDSNCPKLKELTTKIAACHPLIDLKFLEIQNPAAAAIYDLLDVSALPTAVLLSPRKGLILDALVGHIEDQDISRLLIKHRIKGI